MRGIRKHVTTVMVAFVTASVAAGGTAAVAAIINADRLQGYAANQLGRVAAGRSSALVNPLGSSATLVTATIAAPKKGFLVMTASSAIDDSLGAIDGNLDCWLTLDGTKLSTTQRTLSVSPSNSLYDQGCATNAAWPVAAGTHKVRLLADNPGSTAATFGPSDLSVIFEPFNGAGKVPVPVAPS